MEDDGKADSDHKSRPGELDGNPVRVKEGAFKVSEASESEEVDSHDVANGDGLSNMASSFQPTQPG